MPRLTRRARSHGHGGGADRLSELADDLLRLILRRLDTRTALSNAALSRRWACLPRDLPALDLRVGDALPPRYHRAVAIRRGCHPSRRAAVRKLDAVVARCERRAMHALADGINGLLLPASSSSSAGDDDDRRRAKRLRVEFFFPSPFPTAEEEESSGCDCVDRLIPTAIAAWGVEDLELVALPPLHAGVGPAYTLTLANCAPPHRYGALAELVLRDMPASTPMAAYRRLFTSGSPLQALRLESCGAGEEEGSRRLVIRAPAGSRLKELVVDGCAFREVHLRDLPALEQLACLITTVRLRYGTVPRLAHVNLTFSSSPRARLLPRRRAAHRHQPRRAAHRDEPVDHAARALHAAARAHQAPRQRRAGVVGRHVRAAPSLEVLHIHVAPPDPKKPPPGTEISWPARSRFRHRRLKEVVLAGFGRTWRQVFFMRFLARVCKALERVVLLGDWCAREKGLWDWDLVRQRECPWSEEDKMVIRKQIKYGRTWCRRQLQVLVG